MTWVELVEKAKELGYECADGVHITSYKKGIEFSISSGSVRHIVETRIRIGSDEHSKEYFFPVISKNRTPDQIYQIMLALED